MPNAMRKGELALTRCSGRCLTSPTWPSRIRGPWQGIYGIATRALPVALKRWILGAWGQGPQH